MKVLLEIPMNESGHIDNNNKKASEEILQKVGCPQDVLVCCVKPFVSF
jgi:hypothetical protein